MQHISVVVEPYGSHVAHDSSKPTCQQSIIHQQQAGNCFSGTVFEIFLLIAEVAKLNYTIYRVRHFYPNDNTTDVWVLARRLLVEQKVHFNAALWSNRRSRAENFYFIRPSILHQAYDYVVIEKGRDADAVSLMESLKFNNVFALFDIWTWLALGLMMGGYAAVISGLRNRVTIGDFVDCLFGIYRAAVDQMELGSRMTKTEARIVLLWSVVVLITASCFSGLIYMKTTVQPGWVQPFHDLESMKDAGYRFTSNSYNANARHLQRDLAEANNTRLLTIFNQMFKIDPLTRWEDIKAAKITAIEKISNNLAPEKLVHMTPDAEILFDRNCNLHVVQFSVEPSPGRRYIFPYDYNQHSSWLISKRQTELARIVSSAVSYIRNFGLVQAIANAVKQPKVFLTQNSRKRCVEMFRTKIRVPPYNESMGKLMDLTTLFLVLMVGCAGGCVVCVGEKLVVPAGGRETEEEVGKIIRKRKLEGIRNWVNGLADDDSAVDEVFDVYCKDVDRVRERRKWLDN